MPREIPDLGIGYEDPDADPIRDVLEMYENNFDELYAAIVENLDDLGDVAITSPTAMQRIYYNGSTWVNGFPIEVAQLSTVSASDVDWSLSNIHKKTTATSVTFTFSNPTSAQPLILLVENTGGSAISINFPAAVRWPSGTSPDDVEPSSSTVVTFLYIGTTYYGSAVENLVQE
jgi:hypothetical protein